MVMGDPIPVPPGYSGTGPVPEALVDQLHAAYLDGVKGLFDKYKTAAGYENSVLQVR